MHLVGINSTLNPFKAIMRGIADRDWKRTTDARALAGIRWFTRRGDRKLLQGNDRVADSPLQAEGHAFHKGLLEAQSRDIERVVVWLDLIQLISIVNKHNSLLEIWSLLIAVNDLYHSSNSCRVCMVTRGHVQ